MNIHWRLFGPPLAIGLLLRAAWLVCEPQPLILDGVAYHTLGLRLAQGEPYGIQIWPPGWPMILGLLYRIPLPPLMLGLLFNTLLSTLLIILIGTVAQQLFGQATARIAAWIVALMPSYILAGGTLIYEVWLQCLLVLSLMVALRRPWNGMDMLIIGLLTVLITLMRPFWIVLPLLLWLIARPRHGPSLHIGAAVVAQLVAVAWIGPWVIHISHLVGAFVPVSLNGAANFWIGNNPNATGTFMPPPYGAWVVHRDTVLAAALEYIRAYPSETLRLWPVKLWYLLAHEHYARSTALLLAPNHPLASPALLGALTILLNISYWLLAGFALLSSIRLALRRRWVVLLPLLLFGYNLLAYLPFFGVERFRWPLQFLLIIFAAAALQTLWQRVVVARTR